MTDIRTIGAICLGLGLVPTDEAVVARCERLEGEAPRLIEAADVPGLSIAIADRKGVVWSRAFGVRDRAAGAPLDTDTVFEAASLSKPVFAYLVLQLVDEGMIDLDTPLVDYAPLDDVAHDPRHRRITARMALSHTPGLPNWRPRGGQLDFQADPGEEWSYSGEGFVLLQRVVEALTAAPLQELAQIFVFEPLEMSRSSFVWVDGFAENVAFPHDADGKSRPNRRVTQGNSAFSLLTTAPDYARFLAAVMRGEALEGETLQAMTTPQVEVTTGVSWGLGWGLEENEDGVSCWHWGHNNGYRAYTVVYPERDFALVYFTNGDNGMLLLRELVELATGEADHPAIRHLDYPSYDTPR